MTVRAGEPFDVRRAVSAVEAALSAGLPVSGPTVDRGEPVTGEWASTHGEGFLLLPLWEGEALTGVYGREWNEAEERAELHLTTLAARLDARFGPHRTLVMRPTGAARPEPFRTLVAKDCLGDLKVWGPLASGRWAALSLNQSDGDAPMILTALVTDRPLS